MTSQHEPPVIAALEAGRQDLLAAIDGLSDGHAAMRPGEDRWSTLECLEHIVTVEARFQGFITAGKTLEAAQPNPEKEEPWVAIIADRSTRVQAPEAVRPTGRFTTLDAGRSAFHAMRDESVRIARERGSQLYLVGAEHARLGPMNGIEVLYLIAGHARRHAAQIRENRAALGQ